MSTPTASSNAPLRIVFVGGTVLLNTGVRVDSRTPIPEDVGDHIMKAALSSCPSWWAVASELANVLLRQDQRTRAWVLAIGPASLRAWTGPNRFTRQRLKTVFPSQDVATFENALLRGPTAPWVVAHHAYSVTAEFHRNRRVQEAPAPTAIIVSGSDLGGVDHRRLIDLASCWPTTTFIVAHFPTLESEVDALRQWRQHGQPPLPPLWQQHTETAAAYDRWVAAGLKYGTLRPVVCEADLGITRVIVDDREISPEQLSAAVAFVQSRYDLTIDVWDIATDDGLLTLVADTKHQHRIEGGPQYKAMPPACDVPVLVHKTCAEVHAALEQFPLGTWKDPSVNWDAFATKRPTWGLKDPELPIIWYITVEATKTRIRVAELRDGVAGLPLDRWKRVLRDYGWLYGLAPSGMPTFRAVVEAHVLGQRDDIASEVRARMGSR